MKPRSRFAFVSIAVLLAAQAWVPIPVSAQTLPRAMRGLAPHLILPQARSSVVSATPGSVTLTGVTASVAIVEQVATTTLDLHLTNTTALRLEAEVVLPVPEAAVLRGFDFQGAAAEPTAELLAREQARSLYDSIVARTRDPALLEFVGCNLIRSSVFPVEAHGSQRIRLIYEQVLPAEGGRVDYVLPRTESIEYRVPWQIALKLAAKSPVSTVYSPSHAIESVRGGPGQVTVRLASGSATEPGPFRLSWILQREGFPASLIAYPEPGTDGGYFLLLGSPPASPSKPELGKGESPVVEEVPKREVVLVLDRSGSMAGTKLEQVRAAALQVLESLKDGEAFNVIVYSDTVESFSPRAVMKSAATMLRVRTFLGALGTNGGTNLYEALAEALRAEPVPGFLPLVLFLTDGLPTVGRTSELAIRDLASRANPHRRRLFTFGVGADVNTPLLDRLALETRGASTYVLPGEDVEVRVSQVFRRLEGPILSEPVLRVVDASGQTVPGRIRDLLPGRLPDLFDGDQWVVLGRYSGTEPLTFELSGSHSGRGRTYRMHFPLDRASTANAFVPRLWASRKIALLIDAIRDLGADRRPDGPNGAFLRNSMPLSAAMRTAGPPSGVWEESDPRVLELVTEIVRLSREHGILTEYTAFFAREGTDLAEPTRLMAEASRNFSERAMHTRSGNGALNQAFNNGGQRGQSTLNHHNRFLDANLERVQIGAVQQVNDRAFYQRNGRWIDSRLVAEAGVRPDRVVAVGSEEFRTLVHRLAAQNRQGTIALGGEVLLRVDGEIVLVK